MKTTPILQRTIVCPKCENKSLCRSVNSNEVFGIINGREFFCDQCHLYFGVNELVNNWNYDLGDFGDVEIDSVSVCDEPVFKSLKDKNTAYEVVNRMFGNMEEWEDGTTNHGIDIGMIGYPI